MESFIIIILITFILGLILGSTNRVVYTGGINQGYSDYSGLNLVIIILLILGYLFFFKAEEWFNGLERSQNTKAGNELLYTNEIESLLLDEDVIWHIEED